MVSRTSFGNKVTTRNQTAQHASFSLHIESVLKPISKKGMLMNAEVMTAGELKKKKVRVRLLPSLPSPPECTSATLARPTRGSWRRPRRG